MNNPEKTLIILSPGFPKNEADTTCLPLQQNLVRSIKENYPQTNIIVLAFQYPYFEKSYKWFDATVVSFNGRNKGGIPRLLLRHQIFLALKKINNASEIIGLLSFWCGECAAIGQAFANKHGLKHFCWILGQDAKKNNKYPRQIAIRPANLLALSDFLQDQFEKNHKVRPRCVVTPGIEPRQFRAIPVHKDIDIIAVGSLIPLKQYDIFIEVVAELQAKFPHLKAALIGEGPEKERLSALISKLQLENNILITGEFPHTDVLLWMQRAKVFLHPSAYEGFGVVMIEALYAGCHVLSFCKPNKKEIDHWHIVASAKQMTEKAAALLLDPGIKYDSVTFRNINQAADEMMELFTANSDGI